MTRAEILQLVRSRLYEMAEYVGAEIGNERLLRRQLHVLGRSGHEPDPVFFALWREHEAEWKKRETEGKVVNAREICHNMIRCADYERRHPGVYDHQPAMRDLLHEWNEGNLRELCMAELSLEDQTAIEALEREIREKAE